MVSEKNLNNISKQMNLKFDMTFVPKTLSDLLTEVSMIRDFSLKSSKLDFHVRFLEDELRKIDAFKRELPHCMQLLKDAIELLKKERSRLREMEEGPALVTEELIPVRSDERERAESSQNNLRDKKAWMSRVRLWTAPVQFHNSGNEAFTFKSRGNTAVVPLKRAFSAMEHVKGEKKAIPVEEISMPVPVEAIDLSDKEFKHQKKRRRCWSPELHKLFVNALLQLGGPNAATPRQIRDLMKVEGLTNDEVKSHLQKYRLHIRKLPGSTSGSPKENLDEGGSAGRGGGATTDEVDKPSNKMVYVEIPSPAQDFRREVISAFSGVQKMLN